MSLDNSAVVPALATGGYQIEQSLRFNDGDSPYLSRTFGSGGDRQKWTFSAWVKRSSTDSSTTPYYLFEGYKSGETSVTNRIGIRFRADTIYVITSSVYVLITNQLFRDLSDWYHIVVACDTTQGTDSNRMKLYVNGKQITSFSTTNYPAQDANLGINQATPHWVGRSYTDNTGSLDGYMAEVNFVDGQQLDPTSFGETGDYGEWKPIEYTGTYGTTGFYLDFSGTYYNDKSGNGNNFTANNLASTDVVLDSPTNNFPTISDINGSGSSINTITEGGLRLNADNDAWSRHPASMHCYAGSGQKYYCEVLVNQRGNNAVAIGATTSDIREITSNQNSEDEGSKSIFVVAYMSGYGPLRLWTGSYSNISTTVANGGILGMAVDPNTRNIKFYYNGSQVGNSSGYTISTNTATGDFVHFQFFVRQESGDGDITINFGQDSSFAGQKTAQGNQDDNGIGDFYYTPPSGYLALCTANLPEPDVIPGEHFNVKTYGGNNGNQSVTGVGFQPDIVWVKNRNTTAADMLADAIRGQYKMLEVMNPREELTYTGSIVSFNSDGFTIGAGFNSVANSYVSWNWKGGNGTSSNTNGSITSTVSANSDAGISIISYTGTGSNATVGHGLSSAPEFIFAKYRSSSGYGYPVYHKDLSTGYAYFLHSTVVPFSAATYWNSTAPTSSVFSVGTSGNTNASGGDYIAYAFHSVDGFSKIGSFTGNGSTDGSFVYTGFQPEFIILKNVNTERANPIMDFVRGGYNGNTKSLFTHSYQAEQTHLVDYLSNGFKLRTSDENFNESGDQFLYVAFAQHPFKYTNAN